MTRFRGLTVILPVVTETSSLDETVGILHDNCASDIEQVVVVTCHKTTAQSRSHCALIDRAFPGRVLLHEQRLPYLGGAMREAFDLARSSHVLMMSTDLETDPTSVPEMIAIAKQHPNAVVTASRWAEGGSFSGYGSVRVTLNWLFQHLTSVLYRTSITDATFGFRIFPTTLVQQIRWQGLQHELLLETVLKPLRLGVQIYEVPTNWRARDDGESQNSLMTQARYVRTLVQTRLQSTEKMIRTETAETEGV